MSRRHLTCRLERDPATGESVLSIRSGIRVIHQDRYRLSVLGAWVYRLHKLSGGGEVYDVRLEPGRSYCSCPGWLGARKCKHVASLAALCGCGIEVEVEVPNEVQAGVKVAPATGREG